METSSSFIVRFVQFWIAAALLLAGAISAVIAFPFFVAGKIMDFMYDRPAKMKQTAWNV